MMSHHYRRASTPLTKKLPSLIDSYLSQSICVAKVHHVETESNARTQNLTITANHVYVLFIPVPRWVQLVGLRAKIRPIKVFIAAKTIQLKIIWVRVCSSQGLRPVASINCQLGIQWVQT